MESANHPDVRPNFWTLYRLFLLTVSFGVSPICRQTLIRKLFEHPKYETHIFQDTNITMENDHLQKEISSINAHVQYYHFFKLLEVTSNIITGWWFSHPSEKICKSIGMMTFPIYGKIESMATSHHQPGYILPRTQQFTEAVSRLARSR